MKIRLLVSILLLFQTIIFCQVYKEADVKVCESKFKIAEKENLKVKPIGEVIARIGESFTGTDYRAFALEREGEEKLVVDLTGLDCTTFIENALVFARLIKKDSTSFDSYVRELTHIRYRNGIINKYPSRLHYFTDWIYDNVKKDVVEDITKDLGGEKVKFEINFMSTHPDLYKHLKGNPLFIPIIKAQEEAINTRTYYYIPKGKVKSIEGELRDGDIIAFTTTVSGLDVSHTGIAVKGKDGRIHLLHEPQPNMRVYTTKETLSDYIINSKKHTGIIVLRAL
ncbi:MAG: DUF1460 domain-containing protein [Ignavibacteriaceae bacterium]|nr:DUF1460 domain-containing protein [Ignavibacteriaceae bacterium]